MKEFVLKLLTTWLIMLSLSFQLTARERLNFNNEWAFHRGDVVDGEKNGIDDSNWIPVVLPHVMQLEKKHCGGNITYDGTGWYRRYFTVDSISIGKRIVVNFEGVMTNCDVFLNGAHLASHHGGYLGFTVDLTGKVNYDSPNLLAVKVNASHDPLTPPGKPQEDLDFYYYSGIYRDVEMLVTEKIFITDSLQEDIEAGGGVFVTYPYVDDTHAVADVKTHIRSLNVESETVKLKNILRCLDGDVVAHSCRDLRIAGNEAIETSQSFEVKSPMLWCPDNPFLYELSTVIENHGKVIDSVSKKIGIRTIGFDTETGFSINGKPVYLRGANRHQAFPYVGDAAPNSMQTRDAVGIRNGGFNAVRAAHYPHDPAFLDACDEYGLLVVECIPGWQYFNNDPIFSRRVADACRQMIRRDRNHPSVILWETMLNESRYPVGLADSLYRIAHSEYPGNDMYTSGDYFGHEEMSKFFDVLYKQVGSFPSDGNVMTNTPSDLVALKPSLTREWGDGVGDKPRVSISEPFDEHLRQCFSRIDQLEGSGYFDWCMLDANPHMGGHFLWSYNDYTRGSQEETMFSGAVDVSRYPKPSLYMMMSMLPSVESKPMVYVASDNSSVKDTCVNVFSNADKVVMYRNGRQAGVISREEASARYPNIAAKGGAPVFRFLFGTYEPGELKAVAYVGKDSVAEHLVCTPGVARKLKIMAATSGVDPIADGSDLIPVYVVVCDENHNRMNGYTDPVSLELEGDAAIVGDGIKRIGVNPQIPDGGVAFYFIRVGNNPGKIKAKASAIGLEADSVEIEILPFKGSFVKSATHAAFEGNEEDGVVEKESTWQQRILKRAPLKVVSLSGEGKGLDKAVDGDDDSWWIADSNKLPCILTLDLGEERWVEGCRIRFQKDSSSYSHIVQTSENGEKWSLLYQGECTGWDFKPRPVNRSVRYLRLIVTSVSEGRPGVSEITLY